MQSTSQESQGPFGRVSDPLTPCLPLFAVLTIETVDRKTIVVEIQISPVDDKKHIQVSTEQDSQESGQ
jgi:hypothetical protein